MSAKKSVDLRKVIISERAEKQEDVRALTGPVEEREAVGGIGDVAQTFDELAGAHQGSPFVK